MSEQRVSPCCGAEIEVAVVTYPPPFNFTIAAAAARCTSCKAELWREEASRPSPSTPTPAGRPSTAKG